MATKHWKLVILLSVWIEGVFLSCLPWHSLMASLLVVRITLHRVSYCKRCWRVYPLDGYAEREYQKQGSLGRLRSGQNGNQTQLKVLGQGLSSRLHVLCTVFLLVLKQAFPWCVVSMVICSLLYFRKYSARWAIWFSGCFTLLCLAKSIYVNFSSVKQS